MSKRGRAISMGQETHHCDGQGLKRAILAATAWLERNAPSINALNVFPVPDGDTGSNMYLTMQATFKAIATSPEHDVSALARGMSHGALMGARGNSGVILSQILRGFAQGLEGRETMDCEALAIALAQASVVAYKGVSKPVEGTMLTVIREVAEAARVASSQTNDLVTLMQAICDAAKASVARTPTLLNVLRQAGVVDAGGQGLYVLFDGILRYLHGELDEATVSSSREAVSLGSSMVTTNGGDMEYGYCTEFLLQGQSLDVDAFRSKMCSLGDSAIVVGDGNLLRVHVHTFDPGAALSYATSLGILRQVKVDNMQDQHQDFISASVATNSDSAVLSTPAVVAVASGPGLADVFRSLGAGAIIPGGQTMNPSTEEIIASIESVPGDRVIVLPNNKNIIFAATQAKSLTNKQVHIIPTVTMPQGIACLMALNTEAEFDENVSLMTAAKEAVKTIEITRAVRAASIDGLNISEGQVIGLLDGRLLMADETLIPVVGHLLSTACARESEIITIYRGADAEPSQTQQLTEYVRSSYPASQVEIVDGGQPHYHYIISLE